MEILRVTSTSSCRRWATAPRRISGPPVRIPRGQPYIPTRWEPARRPVRKPVAIRFPQRGLSRPRFFFHFLFGGTGSVFALRVRPSPWRSGENGACPWSYFLCRGTGSVSLCQADRSPEFPAKRCLSPILFMGLAPFLPCQNRDRRITAVSPKKVYPGRVRVEKGTYEIDCGGRGRIFLTS